MKRTLAEKITATCKHFNGTQHEQCNATVNYRQLVGGTDFGWALRLPCITDRSGLSVAQLEMVAQQVHCPHREFPTREEAEQEAADQDARVDAALQALKDGKCPTCGKQVTQHQRGPCVYGSCGHRLFQGRAQS